MEAFVRRHGYARSVKYFEEQRAKACSQKDYYDWIDTGSAVSFVKGFVKFMSDDCEKYDSMLVQLKFSDEGMALAKKYK